MGLVLGLSASQFTIGGLQFWAASYLEDELKVPKSITSLALGVMTMVTGLGGSLLGGMLLDELTARVASNLGKDPGTLRGAVGATLCCILGIMIVPVSFGVSFSTTG